MKSLIRAAAAFLIALAIFYCLPNAIEVRLEPVLGPFVSYTVLGDALGCLFIAALYPNIGFTLYTLLTAFEISLLQYGATDSTMAWFGDLVPALLIAAGCAAVGFAGGMNAHTRPA